MNMPNRKLGKFEVTQCANGYILGLINGDYTPGKGNYYVTSYIAATPQDLAEQMIAHLVMERMEAAA